MIWPKSKVSGVGLDLEVKTRSNHQTNILYEFLDPTKLQKLFRKQHCRQIIEKIGVKIIVGGHFGYLGVKSGSHLGFGGSKQDEISKLTSNMNFLSLKTPEKLDTKQHCRLNH